MSSGHWSPNGSSRRRFGCLLDRRTPPTGLARTSSPLLAVLHLTARVVVYQIVAAFENDRDKD